MALFWHRRDLRASDNLGLAAAADAATDATEGATDGAADAATDAAADDSADDGDSAARDAVTPVFVFDDAVLEHGGDARVRFMLDSLAELRAWYRDHGSDLVVAHGDPAVVLPALAQARDAGTVYWNEDYSGLSRDRDARVRLALEDAGVARETCHDGQLHEPGTIRTNAGDPYAVYTYYWKKWQDREKADPVEAPASDALADAEDLAIGTLRDAVDGDPEFLLDDLPPIEALGFEEPAADVQAAGTEAARERLDAFCEEAIFSYDEDRDYPWKSGTSRLSPHLRFGTVGLREVYAATEDAMDRAEERDSGEEHTARESVESFQSQLAWREFYTQVLYFTPGVVTRNYKEYEEEIDWNDDDQALTAWKEGRTGYPIVDAGMRQLRDEAWMHNRVRMIVASFLTKDLLLDWREGYAHFRNLLVDHDTANDNGGWQWAASTGTDAQPYFRIFNPTTQGERYDPDADYIREYVPELEGLDADEIHDWTEMSDAEREELGVDYPAPIVDHSERREQALAMYKRARGEDPDEE